MSETNAFSHLTLEERRIILTGICNGSTKTAIAKTIGTALSHVNSSPVESLGGKSPLELTEFMYKDLYDKLIDFAFFCKSKINFLNRCF